MKKYAMSHGDYYHASDVDAELEERNAMIRALADEAQKLCDGDCKCERSMLITRARALAEGKG